MGEIDKIRCLLKDRSPRFKYESEEYRLAAVLLPLLETAQGLSLLFEVRSQTIAWQPGDICFPGGRLERYDQDAGAAAVRETSEELAVPPDTIQLYGPLDIMVAQMGVVVHPYVGKLLAPEQIAPNSAEVAEVFTVPLARLLEMKPIVSKVQVMTKPMDDQFPYHLLPNYPQGPRLRKTYSVYFYQYEQYLIWGLTARILHDFLREYVRPRADKA